MDRETKTAWSSGEEYARTMLEAGGPRPGQRSRRRAGAGAGSGYHEAILNAVWGRSDEEFEKICKWEEDQEQERNPHKFVRKLRSRRQSGASIEHLEADYWLREPEFSALYAAADYAARCELPLHVHVTLIWRKLGASDSTAEGLFRKFMKCLRAWFDQRHFPHGWIYVHENSKDAGVHTHLSLHVPTYLRDNFLSWIHTWGQQQKGSMPRAIRVRGPRKPNLRVHWILFSYLCKTYDRKAIINSGRGAPDGQAVGLGDVIASVWRDCLPVPIKPRWGVSRTLGPQARTSDSFSARPDDAVFGLSLLSSNEPNVRQSRQPFFRVTPFRSAYEDGARDVRQLYPANFCEFVQKLG